MRYSLLNWISCPRCQNELTSVTVAEAPCATGYPGQLPRRGTPADGTIVGPVSTSAPKTPFTLELQRLAGPIGAPDRNSAVVVETGVLTCGACSAWFPVTGSIPELLPDHLRNWDSERAWLETLAPNVPAELMAAWRAFQPTAAVEDAGAHHKMAEITLPGKVTEDGFWGPGYVSPFNPGAPEHTWHLIRNFVAVEPLLELSRLQLVLDMGCGYAWTTEWMLRGGYEPIGFDICRAYLEIALTRVGPNRPHVFVGDVENLPIRQGTIDAVLGFEAFHHIPNRPAAMREFSRVLTDGRPVVLVEPGGAHEHADVSVAAMEKYGTLEKGMELADVHAYADGSGLGDIHQHFLLRHVDSTSGVPVRLLANEVFTLRKQT